MPRRWEIPDYEKQVPTWSTDVVQLIEQMENLTRPDEVDIQIAAANGGGMRLGFKDGFRQVELQMFHQLFMMDQIQHQGSVYTEADISEHVGHFDYHDLEAVSQTANLILKNWREYVSNYEDMSLPAQIARELRDNLYAYLHLQATTQLGEALAYDPNYVDADQNSQIPPHVKQVLKNFLNSHKLQRREFGGDYLLDQRMLPGMIKSAERREGLPGSTPRESDERENLEILYRNLDQPLGSIFVEVSPPFHKHQAQVMIRFYKMTPVGWLPTIFYVPQLELSTDELMQHYFAALGNRGIKVESVNTKSTVPMLKVQPGQIVENLANLFPLISRLGDPNHFVSGVEVIRAGDAVIRPHLDKYLPNVENLIGEIVADFPNIMGNKYRFEQYVERINRMLHIVAFSTESPEQLIRKGYNEQDIQMIKSGELSNAARQIKSAEIFDVFVDKHVSKAIKSEFQSDCTTSTFQAGGRKPEQAGKPSMKNSDVVIGRDGTTIKFSNVDGKTHIDKCPICGFAGSKKNGIDICDVSCAKCGGNLQEMRQMFEKGTIAKARKNYHESLNSAASLTTVLNAPQKWSAQQMQSTYNSYKTWDKVVTSPVRSLMSIIPGMHSATEA